MGAQLLAQSLHHLSRVESQDFALTRHRLVRWHINDGRSVFAVIRSLHDPRILALVDAYHSDAVRQFILAHYQGRQLPAW